jgi:transcriptional regulator with XRE-family HTH domain
MLHEYFRQTQDRFGVKGTNLAAEAGISTKHLSAIRRGNANITIELFWQLLVTLDRLAPGAKAYFANILAPEGEASEYRAERPVAPIERPELAEATVAQSLKQDIAGMSQEELAEVIMLVSDRYRELRDTADIRNRENLVRVS